MLYSRYMAEYRLVRVPLPVNIVRELDEIVASGRGGFDTRADLVREAVDAFVAELKYGHPDPEPMGPAGPDSPPGPTTGTIEAPADFSILGPRPDAHVVDVGEAEVADEYLFGLHNRDYPTLWAARRLADLTVADLIPVDDFYRLIAEQAWSFGERLLAVESQKAKKLTALFPTNRSKPESSESAFLNFAIGSHSNGAEVRANGPMYVWRLAQLVRRDGTLMIGLTPTGLALLDTLADLTVEAPHAPALAEAFFDHLRAAAPTDWAGFEETLRLVTAGVSRSDLIAAMSSSHPGWTEVVAATNAAGYIARSREWGLVTARQVRGRYELTDFGREMITRQWEATNDSR
jgi:hypothetical protein